MHLQIHWAMKYSVTKNVYMRIMIWKCSWKGGNSHWESLMITSNGGKLSLHLHRFWWFAVWYFSWPTAQQLPSQTLEKNIKHCCRSSTKRFWTVSAIFTDSKQVENPAKTKVFQFWFGFTFLLLADTFM